jgi:hypothetical protein
MSHLYLLGVASLTLTSAGFAGSDMNADLQNRLEAAEARIAELSADQNQNWLNDERADAVRSLVQDVLADADTRASLQGDGSNAGYDGGFTIASGDGNWSLTMNGMVNTTCDRETTVVTSVAAVTLETCTSICVREDVLYEASDSVCTLVIQPVLVLICRKFGNTSFRSLEAVLKVSVHIAASETSTSKRQRSDAEKVKVTHVSSPKS